MNLTYAQALKIASHKHFKGGLYLDLGFIRDSINGDYLTELDTNQKQRAYLHLYPHEVQVWMRREKEWEDFVPLTEDSNTAVLRFRPLLGRQDVLQKLLLLELCSKRTREDQAPVEDSGDLSPEE